MREFMEACEAAARAGGDVLQAWAGKIAAREKAPSDLVTEADVASQQKIRQFLTATFPDHDFLGEEGPRDEVRRSRFRWIVDPLDGTTNYVHGLPNYAVSIALEEDGRIVVGTVFDPVSGECFNVQRGAGAFLNGKRLEVSRVTELRQALLAASFAPGVKSTDPEIGDFLRILPRCQAVRRMGSAALNLCYVAAGRLDGYWATTTHLWDIAAGMLLVEEAGGVFTAFDGGPFDTSRADFVAASTPALHDQLLDTLTRSRPATVSS